MKHRKAVDVLIVGAGPSGMAAALRLRQAGVNVNIIDTAEGITTRSYACGIHPGVLNVLDELGTLSPIATAGHRIESVSLYDGPTRRAELDLADLPGEFRYALALPQSDLEALFEKALERHGVKIHWNHRLTGLDLSGDKPHGQVAKFGLNSSGIIHAETTMLVQSESEITADFVIGTDGADSFVRKALEVELESFSESEAFTLCDFESANDLGHEARLQIEQDGMELLWPISSRTGRFVVQTSSVAGEANLPCKERIPFTYRESAEEKANFKNWARSRAPGFVPSIAEIEWLAEACSCTRLATRFGEKRCWLAGDAAHQTDPVAMHSFNLGIVEAIDLATHIEHILKGTSSLDTLDSYNENSRRRWESTLGTFCVMPEADEWIQTHCQRIASYLPASGKELTFLLEQLGIMMEAERPELVAG